MTLYLFDIDGTLLWTGGAGSMALNAVFESRYKVAGAMNGVSASGKTDPLIIGEMFAGALGRPGHPDEVAAVLADYEAELPGRLEQSEKFRILPNVHQVLDELKADDDVVLAIATGNSAAGSKAKLDHAGLSDYFVCGGYGSDSADRSMLVAVAIARAQRLSGRRYHPSEIVVVGDTERDIAAARGCGVKVVAVATGHPTVDELAGKDPDLLIEDLCELMPWHRERVSRRSFLLEKSADV